MTFSIYFKKFMRFAQRGAIGIVGVAGAIFATISATQAQEFSPTYFGISDIRAGVMFHKAHPDWLPVDVTQFKFRKLEDVTFEVLFTSPDVDAFRWIGSPKINLGGTLNVVGRESFGRAALTWQAPVFDSPVFVEGSLGFGVHNAPLTSWKDPMISPQGCRWTIYSAASVGLNVSDSAYVMATYEHMSNAGICNPNPGLTNIGVKMGMRFD